MITLIISILLIIWLVYKVKTSKSTFFLKSKEELAKNWYLLDLVLRNYNFQGYDIRPFSRAYNYFTENPKEFDGATIVRDLDTIKGLDAPAMVHDYRYILANGVKDRIKADKEYLRNMIKLGVHPISAYLRAYLLMLLNIIGIYTIYKIVTILVVFTQFTK
jgi:hypothetical protein